MTPRIKPPTKPKAVDLVFAAVLKSAGLPLPVREHRFHETRKWRLDYAWPDRLVALEVEGGAYTQGRHTRGSGFIADLLKYSTAAAMGWAVIRCTPKDLCSTQTLGLVRQALGLTIPPGSIAVAGVFDSKDGWTPLTSLSFEDGANGIGYDAAFAAARNEKIPPAKRRKGRAA